MTRRSVRSVVRSVGPVRALSVTAAGIASTATMTGCAAVSSAAHSARLPTPQTAVRPSPTGRPALKPPHPAATPHQHRHGRPRADGPLRVLSGVTVGIDPGHNGGNFTHPAAMNRLIWNGREYEHCNTTGTATDSGYPETTFTFHVAEDLRADLTAAGARVVMTRTSNTGIGPCVNTRARILNAAHVAVAIDIHADGGPPDGRGFAVLEPVPDGINNEVVGPSLRYAKDLRRAFLATGMPISTYDGVNGLVRRDDLAGLNLTTVPTDLIECGNMRNATDAKLLTSPTWQRRAAVAIEQAMAAFLAGT